MLCGLATVGSALISYVKTAQMVKQESEGARKGRKEKRLRKVEERKCLGVWLRGEERGVRIKGLSSSPNVSSSTREHH